MAYDTLTAFTCLDSFHPDPQTGWKAAPVQPQLDFKGTAHYPEVPPKWYWNADGYGFTWFFPDRLQLQVSLPRVLTGSNIIPYAPDNPDAARDAVGQMSREVKQRLSAVLPDYAEWEVFRVDATENFHLSSEERVISILDFLSYQRIPRHHQPAYTGQDHSVMWPAKTRRCICYSKYQEVRGKYRKMEATAHDVESSKGVLRMETRVQRRRFVQRVLQKPLKLRKGDKVTVARILDPSAVENVSTALLGGLKPTVENAIGRFTVTENTLALEDLIERVGLVEATKVIGMHLLYQQRGEEWIRQAAQHRQAFHRTMKRLDELGVDPRKTKLDLGNQLDLFADGPNLPTDE